MSYVDSIRETNETLLRTAQDAVDAASRECPGLIRPAIQDWVDRQAWGLGSLVPDGWVDEAVDVVIAIVQAALNQCSDIIELHRQANAYLGSPDRLRAVADTLNDLGGKADAIQLNKGDLAGWASWDDPPASRTYDGAIDDQVEPLSRVSAKAGEIAGAIDQHANDIENYYLQLAAIVVGAVVTILGVVAAILGVIAAIPTGGVTLAGSIVGIVAAVLGLATMVIGIVTMVISATQGTSAKLDALQAEITEWKAPNFAIVR